jgi:hypothetical protein
LESLKIGNNGLYTRDSNLIAFLNSKDPDWSGTQTIPPENLTIQGLSNDTLRVTWEPIEYQDGKGGYAVYYAEAFEGPFSFYGITPNKNTTEMDVTGLESEKVYFFKIQTQTEPSPRSPNTLISTPSDIVSGELF